MNRNIDEWIKEVEQSDESIDLVTDQKSIINYANAHFEKMPSGEGFEKAAINSVIIDEDSNMNMPEYPVEEIAEAIKTSKEHIEPI